MAHLPPIVSDLAMILLVAGITTILFKKLNQPLVLGYIVAGFITGPHFSFFPTVTDFSNIHTWSEIGIIFLMFSLGLEFSFNKLKQVGSTAFRHLRHGTVNQRYAPAVLSGAVVCAGHLPCSYVLQTLAYADEQRNHACHLHRPVPWHGGTGNASGLFGSTGRVYYGLADCRSAELRKNRTPFYAC